MSYLVLTYLENLKEILNVDKFEFRNKPFSNSKIYLTPIENFKILTTGQEVKKVYDLKLSLKDFSFDFEPGDTIGILPCNDSIEVIKLLIRLNIESNANKRYKLEVSENTSKKNPTLPKHIPKYGILEDIFLYYIDIRKPPKKLFLKALINYTTDSEEVNKLETICSPKGTKEYSDLVNGEGQTLLGLLNAFPSCCPRLEVILEHSLPLQPRFFSISSSPCEKNFLHITFFVVENTDGTKGVCTGWLEKMINESIEQIRTIPFYFRKPNNFRAPLDFSTPIIMIATGTGLAPFKGFLDDRLLRKRNENCELEDAILFYGCRYSNRDYLYKNEIEEYLDKRILTKFYPAFSRENQCYVQDKIDQNAEEFINYILIKRAIVFVCGNSKTMVPDVKQTVIDNLIKYGELDTANAESFLNELIEQKRFIVDSWV